jgi:hypothetical protein
MADLTSPLNSPTKIDKLPQMKTFTLLTALILLLLGGCKKEALAPQLPPYTQEGKNIFACKINGEVFIAKGVRDKNTMSPKGTYNNYRITANGDTLVEIRAIEENPIVANIAINFIYTLSKDNFELSQFMNSFAIVYLPVDNYIFAESRFETNANHTGSVHVKYFQNKILAGTFEFTAIDDRGEVIHVTDGRFDFATK